MNKLRKTSAGLDCFTVSSEDFAVVDDVNVCTAPFGRQRHFGVSSKLKNIIDADSDDENEITAPLFPRHPK
ncbi:hypothetical protein TNCV_415371 [Trichonephila clavipes]|nr:hypothetical protein TNCV_415371 [Trichonephila clavipes]